MQIRSGVLNYDNLWLSLFKSIKFTTASKLINANFSVLEKALPDNKEYYDFYVKTYSEEAIPFPQESPFIWDKQEEETGDTLLIRAAKERNYPVVKRLLNHGALAHIKNKMHRTAIDITLERPFKKGNAALADLLLSSISAKIEFSHLNRISNVLDLLHDRKEEQHIMDPWLDVLIHHKEILPNSTYMKSPEFCFIQHFILRENDYVTEYMLSRDFLVNQKEIQELANQAKSPKTLALLVSRGAIIDPQKVMNDFYTTYSNNLEVNAIINVLLLAKKNQKDINLNVAQAGTGITPLIAAILSQNANKVLKLLQAGADPSKKTAEKTSPLLIASNYFRGIIMIDALLLHGANFNKKEEDKIFSMTQSENIKTTEEREAAFSCLKTLYQKAENEIYRQQLIPFENQQSPTPLEVSELVYNHFDKSTATLVQQFLFFGASKTKDVQQTPIPTGDPLKWNA